MRAGFENLASFENHDFIRTAHGRQPVCDDEDGALFDQIVECLLDFSLGDGVDAGRGFVKNDERWVFQ